MIALTRRSVLQSSVAVGFVTCTTPAIIPTIANAEESVLSMVLRLIEREQYPEDYQNPFIQQLGYGINDPGHIHSLRPMNMGLREMDIEMNTALLTQYPDLFSPRDQIMNRLGVKLTRSLKTQYSIELVQDLKWLYENRERYEENRAQKELLNILSAEYACEFVREKWRLAKDGQKLCQYIPLKMVRAVNPYTFQPYFAAKTLYGVRVIE